MLLHIKELLRSLILPPDGLLILAVIGLLLLRKHRRLGMTLVVGSIASLWLLSTAVIGDALTRATQRFPPLDLTRPVQAQAIVILGGGGVRDNAPEYGGGPAPELELLERLTYGAFVARKTSLPVLVSGTPMETLAMQRTLARDFGLTTRWVEGQSRDTFQNAEFSARMLRADHITRIVLVTSSTHISRATHEFEAAGLQVVPAASGYSVVPRQDSIIRYIPTPAGLMRSHVALYELLGEQVRQILASLHLRRQSPGP